MQPGNILFFTSFNQRSVQMESSIVYFHNKGHRVTLITTCEKGALHAALEKKGIYTEYMNVPKKSGWWYYIKCSRYLNRYCKKNKIDVVHSHLQIPNLISCISRYFISAAVLNVRHNSDVVQISGSKKEKFIDKWVNRMSCHIIAISDKVKTQLVEKERVKPSKIHRINNGYDFKEYQTLSAGPLQQQALREKYACKMLLVSPGRFIPTKRHQLTIQAVAALHQKGYDIKLLILGEGPQENILKKQIEDQNLQQTVFLLPFQENISDYLQAADAMVLLSESEASNNTAKEAGYFEKPVVVCSEVGDFDDYIVHEKNGFLLPKNNPTPAFETLVTGLYNQPGKGLTAGKNLKNTVLSTFDIAQVGAQYDALHKLIKPLTFSPEKV